MNHPEKKSRRLNFSNRTKLTLAKRAGFLCSFTDCLVFTTGPSFDDEGNESAAGIAVAAHIFPASANGPRKTEGLLPEQIRDISNGIWLCHTHGTTIDEFQDDYPPEKVIEMKGIREHAQSLTVKMPDVAFLVGFMGVKRLDAIVRKHWPNPDDELIKLEVFREGVKCLPQANDPLWTRMPSPPVEFDLRPVAKAATPGSSDALASTTLNTQWHFQAERRRAVSIVTDWGDFGRRYGWSGKGRLINHCYVKLCARNPDTGEIAESFVWTRGHSIHMHEYDLLEGEVLHFVIDQTTYHVSNLNWRLEVSIRDGEYHCSSILSMEGRIRNSHSTWDRHLRLEAESYIRLMEKLEQGWEPVGFVGIKPGEWSDPDRVHPGVFQIQNEITEAQFSKALRASRKLALGYELAEAWDTHFRFNNTFFEDALDETSIRAASEDLRAKLGSPPYPIYSQSDQIVSIGSRHGIRLILDRGQLFFRITPNY
ncbi:TPA: HNH endonuclease [Pseudomonas aeruginosa]|uniref:HNH endonuclease n=1 Tax=Pseudomonas aeruginosa TaxID=287 RepID=UPI001161010B|nr:HNH endonuclease [Pseudomonas aeruginosa]